MVFCQPSWKNMLVDLDPFSQVWVKNRKYFETTTQSYFCKAYRPLATRSSKPTLQSGSKLCLRWRRDDHRLTLKNAAENTQLFKSKSGKQYKHVGHSYTLINFDSTKRNCARTASTSRELCSENCTQSISPLLGHHGKRLWPNNQSNLTHQKFKLMWPHAWINEGFIMVWFEGNIHLYTAENQHGTCRKTLEEKISFRNHHFQLQSKSFPMKIILPPATTAPVPIHISIYIMHRPESHTHTEIKQCVCIYI